MSFIRLPVLRHGLTLRHEDILPDVAVMNRIAKLRNLMKTAMVESILIYSDATTSGPVDYLTNYPCYGFGRRAVAVLGLTEGPFLYTAEESRNLPRVRLFTTCDLEKTRQFMADACVRAVELAGDGAIGVANGGSISLNFAKDMDDKFSGRNVKDLSREYAALLAVKDKSSLDAAGRAVKLARDGMALLANRMSPGENIWHSAALADYQLRLAGCEDTLILTGVGKGKPVRPGHPSPQPMEAGDVVVALVGAQYARHWGVTGRTFAIGESNPALERRLHALADLEDRIAKEARPGMTLGELRSSILQAGNKSELRLAEDLPLIGGVGFDLAEHPAAPQDLLEAGMLLQISLADDGEGFTAMIADMLLLASGGGTWLGR